MITPNSTPPPAALELMGVDVQSSHSLNGLAVEGVNWTVRAGEFWVVGGLLRSGKTDFALTAVGALPPVRGSLRLFGNSMDQGFTEEEIHERLRIGIVHDGGLLLRHLTVAENIALPLRYHHNSTAEDVASRVDGWVNAMDLTSQANARSSRVSRNWAQRAGLARACILSPEVLVLDNPLTGLDPHQAQWWLAMIASLAAGHRLMTYHALTMIVTCDDFRPWVTPGRKFAVLRNQRFEVLPDDQNSNQLAQALLDSAA